MNNCRIPARLKNYFRIPTRLSHIWAFIRSVVKLTLRHFFFHFALNVRLVRLFLKKSWYSMLCNILWNSFNLLLIISLSLLLKRFDLCDLLTFSNFNNFRNDFRWFSNRWWTLALLFLVLYVFYFILYLFILVFYLFQMVLNFVLYLLLFSLYKQLLEFFVFF